MKQQFVEDATDTIRLKVYQNNRPVIPSSATVVLYNPDGATLQASASATVDGTTGEMTYSLTTTHTATRDLNYKALWSYVVSGTTYQETQLFDVVRSRLSIPLIDDDLYDELETLRKTFAQQTGTATSGTSSTLLDTARRKEPDSYWKGGTIEILSGTGQGQRRDISAFTQSSSTITVTPNWVTTPDTTSTYRVIKSFNNRIIQCFEEFETMLYDKGNRHQLILESSQIKYPLLYMTIHKICLDLRDEPDDKWDMLAKDYEKKFDKAFSNMKLEYDEDDSGTITEDEEQSGINEVRLFRS